MIRTITQLFYQGFLSARNACERPRHQRIPALRELKLLQYIHAQQNEIVVHAGVQVCGQIAQYNQLKPERLRVYRCIADLVQLQNPTPFETNLRLLYGSDTLRQALAPVNQDERFFGLNTLGDNMQDSAMHRELLAAYRKVWA